jgi:hypothetical protein
MGDSPGKARPGRFRRREGRAASENHAKFCGDYEELDQSDQGRWPRKPIKPEIITL